ncbi:hypothetical protein K8T06_15530, partial [bacterium]|nr:hypothetical protein [bacterium]
MKTLLTSLLCALIGVCCLTCVHAEVDISLLLNQPYHSDGDTLALDVNVVNSDSQITVDLYVCLEIVGQFFFYPSFSSTELDHKTYTFQPGQSMTDIVIPPVILPDDLPDLTCMVYGIVFLFDFWDIVLNVVIETIRLGTVRKELPKPDLNSTFYFMPGVEGLDYRSSQATYDQVAQDIFTHFPRTGLYMRRGITILDPVSEPENQSKAVEAASKVQTTGLALGFHVGVTCHHTYGDLETVRLSDRRYNQWDSDGAAVFASGEYDLITVTHSRYAQPVVAVRRTRAEAHGAAFATALSEYPDTVVYLNGPIEVELRRANISDHHYSDYSPFAVKEFRDWLLHTGIYSDTGEFSGQGVPLELIGNHDFSMDPSPDQSSSRGMTFNDVFGTGFATWDLLYWDCDAFPSPLAQDADPKPQAGQTGHIAGGFDPPRDNNGVLVGGNEAFQNIWDGWRTNQNYDYQTGFGFRQSLVQHYVEDNSRWLLNSGVPFDRNFTHQIPVDFIGNWVRERSSASPFWTAINQYSNVGYTAYFETALQE